MADHSHIEWTDATWNPVTGCSVVSPGCTNCYAMKLAGTRLQHHPSRAGLTRDSKAGPVWTGDVRFNEQWLTQPLRWKSPRRIFVCAHGDLFHEDVPDEWIDRVFAVMAMAPQHTFQVLTKRAARMRKYLVDNDGRHRPRKDAVEVTGWNMVMEGVASKPNKTAWPLPNVWLGVSAEDHQRAEERIPELLATPAAIRFVSAEPLLGQIDLRRLRVSDTSASAGFPMADALGGQFYLDPEQQAPYTRSLIEAHRRMPQEEGGIGLNWVIVGGESGHGARPMHPDWARSMRDQCASAGVPFFFKQWGAWGRAKPRPSGTPGNFALAGAGPHSDFWPAMVHGVDAYPRQINLFGGTKVLELIGKKAAGRLLDGVEHNGMPRVSR